MLLFESSKNFNKEDWFGERDSGKTLNLSIVQQEYTKAEKELVSDNQAVDLNWRNWLQTHSGPP